MVRGKTLTNASVHVVYHAVHIVPAAVKSKLNLPVLFATPLERKRGLAANKLLRHGRQRFLPRFALFDRCRQVLADHEIKFDAG